MFDIDEIKKQFIEVIRYSQGIAEPKVDKLFEDWRQAKRDFYRAMGENLRICVPNVRFHLNDDEKVERAKTFTYHLDDDYGLYDLASFITTNSESFFENKVARIPKWMEENPDYKDVRIGMKLLKAFKYFIYDKIELEQIQNEASMIIQEDKIEGDFYISIHPLDYLSSSENTYNWRSCHALDGEYRAGNLSYMCDESTVVCYLTSGEDKKLPRFPESVPWNSKKWRMLLHFSDNWDMVFAGRQYPFFVKGALDILTEKILSQQKFCAVDDWVWSPWTNYNLKIFTDPIVDEDMYLNYRYIPVNGVLKTIEEIVKNHKNGRNYNDILHSSCYQPYYSKLRYTDCFGETLERVNVSELKFFIGSENYCLHCGERIIDIYNGMVCSKCDKHYYHLSDDDLYVNCTICNSVLQIDYATRIYDTDEFLCDDCWDKHGRRCNICGAPHYRKDLENGTCSICQEDLILY